MPIDRNALAALIERVERGEVGGKIDAEIHCVLYYDSRSTDEIAFLKDASTKERVCAACGRPDPISPAFTISIDAQNELPAEVTTVRRPYINDMPRPWEARAANGKVCSTGRAPTECAARLAAKLRAIVEAKDE